MGILWGGVEEEEQEEGEKMGDTIRVAGMNCAEIVIRGCDTLMQSLIHPCTHC